MHGEGAPVEIGEPGYAVAIHNEMMAFSFRPEDGRIETKVSSHVASFDGWLALKSDGKLRFMTGSMCGLSWLAAQLRPSSPSM